MLTKWFAYELLIQNSLLHTNYFYVFFFLWYCIHFPWCEVLFKSCGMDEV